MALLEVKSLTKRFPIRGGIFRRPRGWVEAVEGVSFSLHAGETLGLVGESGCGKTTLGRLILGLLPADGGKVFFDGLLLSDWLKGDPAGLRRRMQVIFQDPLDSLDPRFTIVRSIAEPLRACKPDTAEAIRRQVKDALAEVQLPSEVMGAYPHELSGGQRQRVGIARAITVRPKLIVCDEPVSSLDLSIQAQVLQLLDRLQKKYEIAYLFISHDLSVVEVLSQQVAVMSQGRVVEMGPTWQVMHNPKHTYTRTLLSAVPRLETT